MAVRKVYDRITPSINRINRYLDRVPEAAYNYFKKQTPKNRGNARNKTKLVNKKTIVADYAYAKRLDEGYSKKAPKGMSKPTLKFVEHLVRLILKRK